MLWQAHGKATPQADRSSQRSLSLFGARPSQLSAQIDLRFTLAPWAASARSGGHHRTRCDTAWTGDEWEPQEADGGGKGSDPAGHGRSATCGAAPRPEETRCCSRGREAGERRSSRLEDATRRTVAGRRERRTLRSISRRVCRELVGELVLPSRTHRTQRTRHSAGQRTHNTSGKRKDHSTERERSSETPRPISRSASIHAAPQ